MLYSCFNPKVVHNVYTGEDIVTRCGKCPACLNIKASQWVSRLDMESQYHRYVLFTTLTYDDLHVPQIVRLRKDQYPNAAYYNADNDELIDCRDINVTFTKKDWNYISDSKVLNVLDKQDVVLFFKRLRYYFNEKEKGSKLRYYITGEYGPRTYRPHLHLLLFYDSEKVHASITELLSKSWSYGDVYDPHLVTGSAADYCASYINSFASLPKIYLHRSISPFCLFSKQIGLPACETSRERLCEIFLRGIDKFTVRSLKSFQFEDVSYWRSLSDRLYPRLSRFVLISHSDRVKIYRCIQRIYESCSEEFFSKKNEERRFSVTPYVTDEIVRGYVFSDGNDFLCRYFRLISSKFKITSRFLKNEVSLSGFKDLPFAPADFKMEREFKMAKTQTQEFNYDSLYNFVVRVLRSLRDCVSFGLSIEEYVTKIEEYYDKKSHSNLSHYYEFQDDYFKSNPIWHLIYFDKKFYDIVVNTDYDCLTILTRKILQYLFNDVVPLLEGRLFVPALELTRDYQNMMMHYLVMSHNKTKTKECNDYALAHKDRFGNIINYQNI